MANNTEKIPIVIDEPDEEELTNPGHVTRVGLYALKKAVEMLCDSVDELKVEIRELKPFTAAVARLRALIVWLLAGVASLALAGFFVWFLR